MAETKLFIDTDPGIDDALAIAMVLGDGRSEVLGLTTVAGNVPLEYTTRNARHLLDLYGAADVPVWSGASRPLRHELKTGTVMGSTGLGNEQAPAGVELNGLAVPKLIEMIKAYPHEVSILALGPLTNLAMAFNLVPELPRLIDQLVIMGGGKDAANMNRVGEFNFWVDPLAADMVMQADVPKTILSLDRCYETTIPLADFEQLKGASFYPALMRMLMPYGELLLENEAQENIVAYDAVAAFALLYPEAVKTEPVSVVVESQGDYTRGMVVFDRRTKPEGEDNAQWVTNVDRIAFAQSFFASLAKLA